MSKKRAVRFNVISPDGFSIHREGTYKNRDEAIAAFEVWKKRFEIQGYYSSNQGRIALSDLANACQIIEL